jgi:hypothetical protein
MAEDWLHTAHGCDAEVGYNWTALRLHNIVDKFGIDPFAESRLAVFEPRYATAVTIATLATLEGFKSRAVFLARTYYDYAHIILFLSWLVVWLVWFILNL